MNSKAFKEIKKKLNNNEEQLNQKANLDVIDQIEFKLKQLEKEKNEIENLYGIDENVLNNYLTVQENVKSKIATKKTVRSNKMRNYENLPDLEHKKLQGKKFNYKTPESLQDSLKYEPLLNDLLDEDEFEPNFNSLADLKTTPTIPKGFDINNYNSYIQSEYINYYID